MMGKVTDGCSVNVALRDVSNYTHGTKLNWLIRLACGREYLEKLL